MDSVEKQERKREAQRRLRSQRRRAGLLRSRVIVVSLVSFALLWGVVFVQMVTGNDPVLGDSSRTASVRHPATGSHSRGRAAASASEAAETTAPEEFEPEVVEPEPVETEIVEPEPEPEPAPITTSQS